MTVREIKEALENCDDDAVVCFGYDYKDYIHTTVYDPITEIKTELKVRNNSYYQSYVEDKPDDRVADDTIHTVVAFE